MKIKKLALLSFVCASIFMHGCSGDTNLTSASTAEASSKVLSTEQTSAESTSTEQDFLGENSTEETSTIVVPTPTTTPKPTVTPTPTATPKPTATPTPTATPVPTATPTPTPTPTPVTSTYVLNTNTKKIHYSTCRDVPRINLENYATWEGTSVAEFLESHPEYSTCGHCTGK